MEAQRLAAEAQSEYMRDGLAESKKAADAAKASAEATKLTLSTNRTIERAYVTMSHDPPGLNISDLIGVSRSSMTGGNGIPRQDVNYRVTITNKGNTPAIVTAHLLHLVFSDEVHPEPQYANEKAIPIRVSLVKGDSFSVFQNHNIEASAVGQVQENPAFNLSSTCWGTSITWISSAADIELVTRGSTTPPWTTRLRS